MKHMVVAVGVMVSAVFVAMANENSIHSLDLHDTTSLQNASRTVDFRAGDSSFGTSPKNQSFRIRYARWSQSRTNYRYNRIVWQLRKITSGATNVVWDLDERYPSDTIAGFPPPARLVTHDLSHLDVAYGDLFELDVSVFSGDWHNSVREIRVETDWLAANQMTNTTHSLKFGVNLSGAEHGDPRTGVEGLDFAFPESSSLDYFTSFGLKLYRVCMSWERMLPDAEGPLNEQYLSKFDAMLDAAESLGVTLVLDLHNYGRRDGEIIGSAQVPVTLFASTWALLAKRYGNRAVWFSLMNEFHTMPGELVVGAQNAAIEAIRATGATNLIAASGNAWSGAHAWHDTWYGTPNSELMLEIVDSLENFVVAVHMYGDIDGAGKSPEVVSETIGSERLAGVTDWAKANGIKLYLEEFGFATNATAMAALDDTLRFVKSNETVYVGATFWAAGRWGEYFFSVEPDPATYRAAPQLKVLADYTDFVPEPLAVGIEAGSYSFEENVISEEVSISWHKGNGILPGYTHKDEYTMIVSASRTSTLSAIVFENGSGAWNRISELRLTAVTPGGGEQVIFHSDAIPFGPGRRIDFAPIEATALKVTLLNSINRATFTVVGLIASETKQAVRIVPRYARYGEMTRVYASADLSVWDEVDSYLYGVRTSSLLPAENPKQFARVIQEITD